MERWVATRERRVNNAATKLQKVKERSGDDEAWEDGGKLLGDALIVQVGRWVAAAMEMSGYDISDSG